jgi:signal transduction histidine kinase
MSVRFEPQLVKPVGPEQLDSIIKQTRNFAVLHEVSKRMQREHNPKQMLGAVLDLLLEVTNATRGYVALLDDAGSLRIEVTRHRGPRPTPGQTFAISQTVSEHVVGRRCGVICRDAAADERFQSAESLFLSDVRSLMAVPIVLSDRVLGMIEMESSHLKTHFSEQDLDLLSAISATVGVSLDNLELTQKLIKSEQLAAVGRLAAGIAHEVKNHLGPFMLADMIAKRYPDDQQIQESAEMMLEAQQHILDLVSEIRNFVSGSETTYTLEPHDLAEVVERVVRFMQCDRVVKKAEVSLACEDRPLVDLDAKGIRQVLINLIRNAADALPEQGGRIQIRIKREGDRAYLHVADNGRGIPEEIQSRIYEPFFTTKGDKGLGLGLDISKKIIEAHHGELDFRSVPGKGTTFRICLPVR